MLSNIRETGEFYHPVLDFPKTRDGNIWDLLKAFSLPCEETMELAKMHQLSLLSTIHREILVGLTHQTCKDQANTNTDGEALFRCYLVSKAGEGIKLILWPKSTWGIQIPRYPLQQHLSTLKQAMMKEWEFLLLLLGLLLGTSLRTPQGKRLANLLAHRHTHGCSLHFDLNFISVTETRYWACQYKNVQSCTNIWKKCHREDSSLLYTDGWCCSKYSTFIPFGEQDLGPSFILKPDLCHSLTDSKAVASRRVLWHYRENCSNKSIKTGLQFTPSKPHSSLEDPSPLV